MAGIVRPILLVHAGLAIAWIGACSVEYGLLSSLREGVTYDELLPLFEASAERIGWLQLPHSLTWLMAALVGSMWIYRANMAVHDMGADGLDSSPGWAVGWFFVPLGFLWKPHQAMRQLAAASESPDDWRGRRTPYSIGLWWFLWISSGLFWVVTDRLAKTAEAVPELITLNRFIIGSLALEAGAAILFAVVIETITRKQRDTAEQRSIEVEALPS